jgi:transcriptional regulator with XRE-family HTH domain
LGLPQPQMAALLDVSLRQYQRWEAGTSTPRTRERERILAVLSLRGRNGEASPPADVRDELHALRDEVEGLRHELQRLEALVRPAVQLA